MALRNPSSFLNPLLFFVISISLFPIAISPESQTLSNIVAIQDAIKMPIIRPLSGMNKEEIVNQAEEIGTYNISIEPYEDCCYYFVPPNPETKSKLDKINKIEEKIKIDNIINKHIDRIETKDIIFYE